MDEVDYSQAQRVELKRHQRSQELLDRCNYAGEKVRMGFISPEEHNWLAGNEDVVFDVLPSFEMLRSVNHVERDPQGPLPGYDVTSIATDTTTMTSTPTETDNTPSLTTALTSPSIRNSLSWEDEMDTMHIMQAMDNVHKLPTMPTDPKLTVEVHVTKCLPLPGVKPTPESMLKEYTSGDAVHGYVVISNQSDKPIKFQMFNMSLKGTVSVVDTATKKMHSKRFLNMVDMNATWTYGCISPSTNVRYEPGTTDWDGCCIGFNNDRILEPRTKYKKFFYFKVPYTLLDNTCRHQQQLHNLLPPSFGIDKYAMKGKYSRITVDKTLHYGHNGTRGSPVLTNDLSNGNKSVNYSVNATLIGIQPLTNEDNNNNNHYPTLAVMKSAEYALRFIPFGFNVSLFSSVGQLKSLKQLVEASFNNAKRCLKMNQQGVTPDEIHAIDQAFKRQQLLSSSDINDGARDEKKIFPLKSSRMDNLSPNGLKVETHIKYHERQKKSLFTKSKQSLSESGDINIVTTVPQDGLPYVSPSLIRKVNKVDKLNATGLQNIDTLNTTLSKADKKVLNTLELNMSFKPSDMTTNTPELTQIESSLVVMNVYSTSAIPIKLSSDVVINDGITAIQTAFKEYSEQLDLLKVEMHEQGLNIDQYVAPETQQDIIAMREIKGDMFTLPVLKNKLVSSSPWTKKDNGEEYTRTIKLSLEYHDDIIETLVTNFQTCLLSRLYCIRLKFKFKNCDATGEVDVPIRLRWFDENS